MSNKKVRIYACGGTGVNIVNMLEATNTSGLAAYDIAYIDSSDSNLVQSANTYRIPDMNGAGKEREVMLPPAQREVPNILVKYEPSDVNILVSSAGGATGAVIATVLAEEIWARGKRVIFFVVGSSESKKTAENTRKHLSTLNGIARKHGHASVVFYDTNEDNSRRTQVDRSMVQGLTAFLDLYSGNHRELDTKDVENWLFLEKSAGIAPQLVLMDIDTSHAEAQKRQYPISVAMIHSLADAGAATIPADYTTEGYRRDGDNNSSLYFSIHTEGVNNIISDLVDTVSDFDRRALARQSAANAAFSTGNTNDSGWEI